MLLFLDTETVPSQAPAARDEARAAVKPPGTYKKAESIAAWYATEGEAAAEDLYRRQALDGGLYAEIIAVSIVDDHDRQFFHCRRQDESEAELLREAFAAVDLWTQVDAEAMLPGRSQSFPVDDHHPVAHNALFDLGLLWRRCAVLSVQRPRWLPSPLARPGRDFTCTMQAWAGFGKTVGLDPLCKALGVASPKGGDITGATVFDAWLAGRYDEIGLYNLADAVAVREVYHRMLGLPRAAA